MIPRYLVHANSSDGEDTADSPRPLYDPEAPRKEGSSIHGHYGKDQAAETMQTRKDTRSVIAQDGDRPWLPGSANGESLLISALNLVSSVHAEALDSDKETQKKLIKQSSSKTAVLYN